MLESSGRWGSRLVLTVTAVLLATLVRVPAAEAEDPEVAARADLGSVDYPGYSASADGSEELATFTARAAAAGSIPVSSYKSADYVSAGVGGMRYGGEGEIALSGVSGSVIDAYLFWQGPTNVDDSGANAAALFDGNAVTGVNLGFSSDNCWGYANSQAYRADVTEYVDGDGTYTVSGLTKGSDIDVNGASLVVIFDDSNLENNRRITIYNGNDSNIANTYDAEGWNVTLNSIAYAGGAADVELHVSDGQSFYDDALRVGDTELVPVGPNFQGDSVPGGTGPQGDGGLWDIHSYDISGVLQTDQLNDLEVTTGVYSDCLSLVVAIVAVVPSVYDTYFDFDPLTMLGVSPFYGFSDDPVNTASGNFTMQTPGLDVADNVFGMDWSLSYNAQDQAPSAVGAFGPGWSSLVETGVESIDDDGTVLVRLPDGRRVDFAETGRGTYTRPSGFYGDLYGSSGGFEIDMYDGSYWLFDAQDRLASMTSADGQQVDLIRIDGKVVALTSSTGLTFDLTYTGDRVTKVTSSDGRDVSYGYDADGRLVSQTDVSGAKTDYTYDAEGRLATVVDPAEVTQVANVYDNKSRVIQQTTGAGATASFGYDDATGQTKVTYQPSGETIVYEHNPLGQLVGMTDAYGKQTKLQRQGDGELASISDRNGEKTAYSYDRFGNLVREVAPDGATTTHTYDWAQRLTSTTDPLGHTTTYDYSGNDRLPTTVTGPTGAVSTYEVREGLIRSVTDPDGVRTAYDYNARRLMSQMIDDNGGTTTFAYDDAGNQTSVTSPEGRTVESEYDALGRLVSETTAAGTTTYARGPSGRLTEVTDALGGVTAYSYDARGRLTSMTDVDGYVTRYEFDAYDQLVARTAPGGAKTTTTYGPLGRVASTTDALGNTSRSSYDADGQLTEVESPRGGTMTSDYDANGRVVSRTNALGQSIAYTYDKAGRVTSVTDADGGVTTNTYDEAGRLLTSTGPDGGVSKWAYTDAGRLAKVSDPTGRVTTYRYDDAGRQVGTTDGLGRESTTVLDGDGLMVESVTPSGKRTTYQRNASGEVVKTTGPDGVVTTHAYDALRRLTGSSTGATSYQLGYDGRGNITRSVDGLGHATSFTVDGRENRTATTDALGRVQRSTFDLADRLTTAVDGLGRTTSMTYDGEGNVTRTQDPSGRSVLADYDGVGRATKLTFGDGTTQWMTYDAGSRLTSASDSAGATTYGYDSDGNVSRVQQADGSVMSYEHDAAGRRTKATFPDGSTLRYSYDDAGQLVALDHSVAGHSSFDYDADGHLVKQVQPSGLVRTWTWTNGQVSAYRETGAASRSSDVTYDSTGRVATITGSDSAAYTYDNAGELVRAITAAGTEEFAYDAVGNLTQTTRDGTTVTRSVDAANQLTSASDGTTYAYDGAGRLTEVKRADGERLTLAYDVRGLLVQQVTTKAGRGDETTPDPCVGKTATIKGTPGNDTITGTSGNDVIFAGDGDDVVDGAGGDDVICGEGGNDRLLGSNGDDVISGGAGDDTVLGGNGIDVLVGGDGNDRLTGDNGNDTLDGGAGNDVLAGVLGDDQLNGGPGTDTLTGDRGSDALEGGSDVDAIDGGQGADHCENEPSRVACEISLPQVTRGEVTTITRGYDSDRLLTHVTVGRPDGGTDQYELTWDRTAAVPVLAAWVKNGVRTLVVHGPGGAYTVTGTTVRDLRHDVLGNVTDGDLAKASGYSSYGVPSTSSSVVGLGYRGELHVGDLVYLRARDLDPVTGRFTTTDRLAGVEGASTVANAYHYADGDPVNKVDPLGLKPTDGDLDQELAEPDLARLQELGLVSAAGFPFWLFNPWHRETQIDLAAKVGGVIECPVPGGGPNGGIGRVDVCAGTSIWEVKYFGPQGIANATDQLARYIAANPSLRPGRYVSSSNLTVGTFKLFAFSVGATGVRLYMPIPWIRAISLDPLRAADLRQWVTEAELAALLAAAGAAGDSGDPGWQFPDIHLPDIPAPDPETTGKGIVTTIIVACIFFCIPTPWPVL